MLDDDVRVLHVAFGEDAGNDIVDLVMDRKALKQ